MAGIVLWPVAALVLYGLSLPWTVQSLDTGELVSHSAGLYLIHPPGYPLFQWLTHFWIKILPARSVFQAAAISTALYASAVLCILAYSIRSLRAGLQAVLMVPLISSPLFWQYAVLPDVFMLNLLLLAALLAVISSDMAPGPKLLMLTLLMALGAAHHHTLAFMLPLWIAAFVLSNGWRYRLASVVIGVAAVVLLYSTLWLLDLRSLSGWRELKSWGELAAHFLRSDYGTLNLKSGPGGGSDIFWVVRLFVISVLMPNPIVAIGVFAVPILYAVNRPGKHTGVKLSSPEFLITASLWLYIAIFFPMVNLERSEHSAGVAERFFLLPMLLGVWLAAIVGRTIWGEIRPLLRKGLVFACVLLGAWNVGSNWTRLDYSTNTAIEDYSLGLLRLMPTDRPTVLIPVGDTVYNSLIYAQNVLHERTDVMVLPMGRLFDRDLIARAELRLPGLSVDRSVFDEGSGRGIGTFLVKPNVNKFDFAFTTMMRWKGVKTVLRPLGAIVLPGDGISVDMSGENLVPNRTSMEQMLSIRGYDEAQEIFSRRCYSDFMGAANTADPAKAMALLDSAIKKVPFCIPAIAMKCRLYAAGSTERSDCEDILNNGYRESYFNYW